jgi:hypothetical protein
MIIRRRAWGDLTPAQRTGIMLISIVQFALLAVALWDIRRRPAAEINGTKIMWTLLSLINFVGPISYFLMGRKRSQSLILVNEIDEELRDY